MKNKILKVYQPNPKISNDRRQFLKLSGIVLVGSGLLFACDLDDDNNSQMPRGVFDLGKGDLGVLNYAYGLEQLEADFYTKVVNGSYWASASSIEKQVLQDLYYHEVNHRDFFSAAIQSGIITDAYVEKVYMQISKHEQSHVTYLFNGLTAAGVTPGAKPEFDFTAGGLFDPFNTSNPDAYAQLLALAQAFEDTGVRAYKGQAGNLQGSPYLTAGLQFHSVEARHASEIRRIRGIKGWITGNERGTGMPSQTQAVYDGEENVIQGTIDVTTLGTGHAFSFNASTEACDETISGDVAAAIASLSIVS